MILPATNGTLTANRALSDLTWLRVGGPAEWFFQPRDIADLTHFLTELSPSVPLFAMGVGSNLIVRDGGIDGIVLRLGRGFNAITIEGDHVTAGAAALDAHVARRAAQSGLDLTFLRTIPGSIGGALRMNAGCYGSYVADHFVSARIVLRDGKQCELFAHDIAFGYRETDLPGDCVITEVTFRADHDTPARLEAKMEAQIAKRDASQPTKERSAGSTFRNPAGFSSTGRADDCHDLKAWRLIDAAGLRGATNGGAQMSVKHPNFLINTGGATATELEELGEIVREKVFQKSAIRLQWEVIRVGKPVKEAK